MSERLEIRNFGPIKKADIEVGDLTVFVGPQATGKSLTAQILYFFRRLEQLVSKKDELTEGLEIGLKQWLGSKLSVYTNTKTILRWSHPDIVANAVQEIAWTREGVKLNWALQTRMRTFSDLSKAEVYIPSGRALYTFLPPYVLVAESRFIKSQDWPGYITEFYGTLGRTIRWLHENQERANQSAEAEFLRSRIQNIIKGELSYGTETVSLKIGQKTITPTTMAGGQMEIWPFWAIVEVGNRSKRLRSARIYFDEPEAHLHPAAQKAVVEIIACLVHQQKTQFVLTTHSPYILYAINVLLQAHEVQSAGQSLPPNIAPQALLAPNQVAAYRFSPDGTVHSIKDPETNLIDEEELDRVADDLGTTFTELLEKSE